MDEIELLRGILTGTGDVIEGVGDDQWSLPTPCPDYDVSTLVDHILGWAPAFAAGANGEKFEGDPSDHHRGDDPAREFRAAADRIVAGWEEHGFDREVSFGGGGGDSPGPVAFNMTVMETLTHGWDLATATGQPMPWSDEQAAEVLARAEKTLPAQYRGDGMPFGDIVEVPDTAPPTDRVAAFMGRTP
ncbi:MAG: hypothetical protein QOG43_1806 [Actinomycetota bacterium]|nr:hypothetical protein [Actinomycetota bacterium]